MLNTKTIMLCALLLLTASLLTAAVPTHAAPLPQVGDEATLRVINESEETICGVAVCHLDAEGVEDCPLLAEITISPGANRVFDITSDDYIVVLVDCEGNVLLSEEGLIITDEYELLFTGPIHSQASQDTDATLRIINESDLMICYVFITPVTADGWGIDWLGRRKSVGPGASHDFDIAAGNYDVLLDDCEGNQLLDQRNITISELYELHFTGPDLCEPPNQEGMKLLNQAQYRDAFQQFQVALTCYREANNRKGEGTTLNNIGGIYDHLGQYTMALDCFQQALFIYREIGDWTGEGTALNNIGLIYYYQGQYTAALDYFQQALSIRRKVGDRAGEGTTLNNIGSTYESLGQYAAALDYFQQALAIHREVGDRTREGATLNNIGLIYGSLGKYAVALDYFQQALSIRREVGDRAGEGTTLNNIGLICHYQGQYTVALDYYKQDLAIIREIGDRAGEAASLHNIGGIYGDQGQYMAALDHYEQALAISREIGDRSSEGTCLNSIGIIYSRQGQYAAALDCHEQALSIRRAIGDWVGEAVSLADIGSIYYKQGQYVAALDYCQQALTIIREIGIRVGEGTSLNSIGSIYGRQGQYTIALDYYEQALAIQREIDDRSGEGTTLSNIGLNYYYQRQYVTALDYFQQALSISREIGDRAQESISLVNIGGIYFHQGQYAKSLDYTEQALAIQREIGDRTGEGITFSNIGGTYERQNQSESALLNYEQAMTVFEAVRATVGSETGRASFIAQYANLYNHAVNLYHIQSQDALAFFTSERGRARTFLDALATGYIQLSDTPADLYAREVEAYAARQAVQQALIQARAQWPDDTTLLADLEAQLAQAEVNYEVALAAITARSDQLAALVPGRSSVLEISQVQALLDDETTLVVYWVLQEDTKLQAGNQILAFVITRDTLHTVAVDVPYDDLVVAINDFRNFTNLEDTHPESLVQLYGWLIAPLREHLTTPHLAIIPHDVLHYLPFAALTDGERFLVEDYTITYLPSASTLPFIQENAERAGGLPLILGNPATGDYDATASFATERDGLGPLLFAEREAQAIAALYDAPVYIGPEATEGLVWQMAGESGILHLAAHGKYNPVAPLSSLIALSPDDEHDGWLTVGEIYGLDLQQANLVVLSACETQLGDLSRGDELVGMTRAFIYAGTPTIVASLWAVEDQATAQLMERFYTHLQAGMGKAEALRQAQLDIRAEYPHPYYWAAFVLSGDAGKTSKERQVSALPTSFRGFTWPCGVVVSVAPLLLLGLWLRQRRRLMNER